MNRLVKVLSTRHTYQQQQQDKFDFGFGFELVWADYIFPDHTQYRVYTLLTARSFPCTLSLSLYTKDCTNKI